MMESVDPAEDENHEAGDSEALRRLILAVGVEPEVIPSELKAALEALAGEILRLRDERSQLKAELKSASQLADRDPLCPVFNRRAFEREVSREISIAERYASPLSLIFIDLDRFKLVNDRFGHAMGDRTIQEVATRLKGKLRQSDIVGRLGGDEFGVVLNHAELEHAEVKAVALEQIVAEVVVYDPDRPRLEAIHLGASCGTVTWAQGESAEQLIARADEAMFRRKRMRK